MAREFAVRIVTIADETLLRPMNAFVRSLFGEATGPGIAASDLDNVELAFNEALANIIRHAYEPAEKGVVTIEITLTDSEITFCFEDNGKPYDPYSAPEPDFERPRDGGLGIWLMKRFMDEFVYRRDAGEKNVLKLVKKFPGRMGRRERNAV